MKTISPHAEAAKKIRQELKKVFPETKFTVNSDCFSGGNSVHIEWTNGPTEKKVGEITYKYQYGSFDSMRDLYEYTNRRNDVPQVKFVQDRRNISDDIINKYFDEYRKTHVGWEVLKSVDESNFDFKNKWRFWTAREYILRKLQDVDLTNIG